MTAEGFKELPITKDLEANINYAGNGKAKVSITDGDSTIDFLNVNSADVDDFITGFCELMDKYNADLEGREAVNDSDNSFTWEASIPQTS